MKKYITFLTFICMVFRFSNAYALFSPYRVVTHVQVLDNGIAFTLSGDKIHAYHNTGAACINRFVILEGSAGYDVKVSGILAAWATNRTMSVNYDAEPTSNCLVKAANFTIQ